VSDAYLSPCECDQCKAGNHCDYCRFGNPGSHFLFVPSALSVPEAGKPVLAWFPTCFPQYRRGAKIVMPGS
jgi:hypothetical protein